MKKTHSYAAIFSAAIIFNLLGQSFLLANQLNIALLENITPLTNLLLGIACVVASIAITSAILLDANAITRVFTYSGATLVQTIMIVAYIRAGFLPEALLLIVLGLSLAFSIPQNFKDKLNKPAKK